MLNKFQMSKTNRTTKIIGTPPPKHVLPSSNGTIYAAPHKDFHFWRDLELPNTSPHRKLNRIGGKGTNNPPTRSKVSHPPIPRFNRVFAVLGGGPDKAIRGNRIPHLNLGDRNPIRLKKKKRPQAHQFSTSCAPCQ